MTCLLCGSCPQEKWLAQLKVPNLRLLCTVYFGTVKLHSRPSAITPVQAGVHTDPYGTKTYQVEFPSEKFTFHDLDLSGYDVEKEMGGYPFAIIRVDYCHRDRGASGISASVTLGWSRVKLYQHRSKLQMAAPPGEHQWQLLSRDHSYTVHAGPVSDNIVALESPTPSSYAHGEELFPKSPSNLSATESLCTVAANSLQVCWAQSLRWMP